jgi:hypothetical protein
MDRMANTRTPLRGCVRVRSPYTPNNVRQCSCSPKMFASQTCLTDSDGTFRSRVPIQHSSSLKGSLGWEAQNRHKPLNELAKKLQTARKTRHCPRAAGRPCIGGGPSVIAHGDVAHGDDRIGQHLVFMPSMVVVARWSANVIGPESVREEPSPCPKSSKKLSSLCRRPDPTPKF